MQPQAAENGGQSSPQKRILVLGGASGMGAWTARSWFAQLRDVARITLADVVDEIPNSGLAEGFARLATPVDAVRVQYGDAGASFTDWRAVPTAADPPDGPLCLDGFDLVVLGVPAEMVEKVAAAVGTALRPGAWMIDMSSVKGPPVESMLRHAGPGIMVAGVHPLFGTAASDLVGRPVALTPTERDDGSLAGWLEDGLRQLGAHVVRTSPDEHDRYMLLAQTLTHFTYLVFGRALTRGFDGRLTLGESLRFATPPYQALSGFTSRIIAQNPRLYAQIQTSERSEWVRDLLVESARELADSFRGRSQDEIEKTIREVADAYSGEDVARAFAASQAFFNGVNEITGNLRRRMLNGQLTVIEVGSPVRPPQNPRQHAGLVRDLTWDSVVLEGALISRADVLAAVYDDESEAAAKQRGLSGRPQEVEIPLYRVLRVLTLEETEAWRASKLTPHRREISVLVRRGLDVDLALSGLKKLCASVHEVRAEPVGSARWLERYGMRQLILHAGIYGDRDPDAAMRELEQWLGMLGFVKPDPGA